MERLAFTVKEFCETHSLSVHAFNRLQSQGRAPRTIDIEGRKIITIESAKDWRLQLCKVADIARLKDVEIAESPTSNSCGSLSIDEWCKRHSLSRSTYYKLAKAGIAPRTIKVLDCTRISEDADREWVKAREADTITKAT